MSTTAKKFRLFTLIALIFVLFEADLYFFVDRQLSDYIKTLDTTHHALIDFFRSITDLGKSQYYLWPCGIATIFCAFLSRGKDVKPAYRRLCAYIGVRSLFLFATIGLSGIIADIIKATVGRARPWLWLRDGTYGFHPLTTQGSLWNSMPSGHSTTVFALAVSLTIFYPRLRSLWFAYAIFLGASRVMVEAHYLSDVCAGALLGWLTTKLFLEYMMVHVSRIIPPLTRTSPSLKL